MKRRGFAVMAVAMALARAVLAQIGPAVELERAMIREQVDGDLNGASAAYKQIAANASAPREVRAKALLQLAGCYEKLGQEAGEVYGRIVREYADQPAAAQARTKLAALQMNTGGGVAARRIDRAGREFSAIDTDGQRVVYRETAQRADSK